MGTNLAPAGLKVTGPFPPNPHRHFRCHHKKSGQGPDRLFRRDVLMADFDDLVRTEAYRIWEAEGRPEGQHERHWQMAVERVQAEIETSAEITPVVPLPLKRVALSARSKRRPALSGFLRASA